MIDSMIMRHIIIVVLFLFSQGASAQMEANKFLKFDTEHYTLGTLKKGDKKTFEYTFKNDGKDAIEIDIVSACECTELDWTRGKIAPGGEGKIYVSFDSTEKESSETVDVDMTLLNTDPKTGYPIFKIVTFDFILKD